MDRIIQDFRQAARVFVRQPGFAAVAVLTLALGIGGNSAIFAFVDGFVLNPFPYPDASRVIGIGATFPRLSGGEEDFIEALSGPEFLDIRQSRTIQAMTAFDFGNRSISGGDRPERVGTAFPLTDPFPVLGLRPLHGRGFAAEEFAPKGPSVAVLSYRLWRGRFGGDVTIVGRSIDVSGQPTTVVGIMPPELVLLGADLWLPFARNPIDTPRGFRNLTLIGRLAPTVTIGEANAELATIAARIAQDHGARFEVYDNWRLTARSWADVVMGESRTAGFLVLGAVGLVLLIACANLANLFLARSASRQRELAIRLTLGARSLAIARQLLAETALLAVAGATLGLLIAHAVLSTSARLVPARLDTLGVTASINPRVLAWTGLLTVGSAILVALLPAFQITRADLSDAVKADGRHTTSGRAQHRMRSALVVAEIALALMLLAGATLLMRSFNNLRQIDPGVDPRHLLTMRLTLPAQKYEGDAINAFFQQLIDRLEQVPGVRSASAASQLPIEGFSGTRFSVAGREADSTTIPNALLTVASAEHFETFRLPLIAGRTFSTADRADSAPVVIANEAFVVRFLGGVNPIGQRLVFGTDAKAPPREIVGVVGNARNRGVAREPEPELFAPMHQQTAWNQLFVTVRTEEAPVSILPTVRREVAALDPAQPIYQVRTFEDVMATASLQQRLSMILLGAFSLVALSLAAIGIYGVMSQAVSARTIEIGIRMALGAQRGQVIGLILSQVLRLTVAGAAIGIALVLAGGRFVQQLLFEVQPSDPLSIGAVAAVLAAVAVFAGWWPARRASRIEPLAAIRTS